MKRVFKILVLLLIISTELSTQAGLKVKAVFSNQMINSKRNNDLKTVSFWINANSLWDAYKDSSYVEKHFEIIQWVLGYHSDKSFGYKIVEMPANGSMVSERMRKSLQEDKNYIKSLFLMATIKLNANGKEMLLKQNIEIKRKGHGR